MASYSSNLLIMRIFRARIGDLCSREQQECSHRKASGFAEPGSYMVLSKFCNSRCDCTAQMSLCPLALGAGSDLGGGGLLSFCFSLCLSLGLSPILFYAQLGCDLYQVSILQAQKFTLQCQATLPFLCLDRHHG